jgi:hypothetical protein
MNRIVREHYPVEKLPEDLREGLGNVRAVKLVIEPETVEHRPSQAAIQADMARWVTTLKPQATDSVERVRRLRDEWDR